MERKASAKPEVAKEPKSPHHKHHHATKGFSLLKENLLALGIVIGIYVCYIIYGYNQEHIYRLKISAADANREDIPIDTTIHFNYTFFLVFVSCIANFIVSFLILINSAKGDIATVLGPMKDKTVVRELFYISITCTGSMLFSNYALTHVSYPTQVLVKSAKMVPILIGGFIVFRRTYPLYEYIAVGIITVSLIAFNFAKEGSGKQMESTITGLVILCLSLICDGLTGPRQDRLISSHSNLTPVFLMFLTNIFALIQTFVACLLVEGIAPIQFIYVHENALFYILLFAISGSIGQLFIYQSLVHFGSLYTSLLTTIRKATTTIFSVYIFGHVLNVTQWVSVVAIFSTLMVHAIIKHQMKQKQKQK